MSKPRDRSRVRMRTETQRDLAPRVPEVPPEHGEPLAEALAREELQAELAERPLAAGPPPVPGPEAGRGGKRIRLVTAMSAASGWAARWVSRNGQD